MTELGTKITLLQIANMLIFNQLSFSKRNWKNYVLYMYYKQCYTVYQWNSSFSFSLNGYEPNNVQIQFVTETEQQGRMKHDIARCCD